MRNMVGIFAAICLSLPTMALAEVKVGFVNTVKLMEEAPQAKAAISKMEGEFAPREKELVAIQRDIKTAEDKLSRDAAVMSDSDRTKVERDLVNRKRDLKRSQDEFREDLNIRRNEELAKLQRRLYDAIVDLAKAENYDLIVSEGVVFASTRIDITDAILTRLKKSDN
ncbi:MAG: OmpH family outer membrane protein [Gammaproteobacteria bacterium]|nr:OmpH family outer membrane protein [Gammaproteobacteria bacterium]